MRINSINNAYSTPSFGKIMRNEPNKPEELFGNTMDLYDTLSDAKGLDIWVMKNVHTSSQFVYTVLMQNKKGEIVKTLVQPNPTKKEGAKPELSIEEKEKENEKGKVDLLKRINTVLFWYNASDNLAANNAINNIPKEKRNSQLLKYFSDELIKVQCSTELAYWERKVQEVPSKGNN